jgi:ADP-dependent NAD(P)H-hydrate dehydratase / NAD(P)H-hydrate epimerase
MRLFVLEPCESLKVNTLVSNQSKRGSKPAFRTDVGLVDHLGFTVQFYYRQLGRWACPPLFYTYTPEIRWQKPLYVRFALMQKVLTAAQMREVDRLTTERYGIPSIILMKNAAHAVARVITEKLGGSVDGKSILILCGPGNNGGDGAALARHLGADGAFVDVVLFGRIKETKGDARTNFGVLCRENFEFDDVYLSNFAELREVVSKDEWNKVQLQLWGDADVVVDAIFGTGLTRPLDIWIYNVVHEINFLREDEVIPKLGIAVDIPTGLEADTGKEVEIALRSDFTVTFTAPKAGNVLPKSANYNGELIVADIGSPAELIDEQPSQIFLAEENDVAAWLKKSEFSNSSYKNKRGHALMIAGSRDYSGAAVLCGDAAIRSGCGLVTIATPESSRDGIIGRISPEVMVRGISETTNGSAAEKAFDEIAEFSKNVDVIAVGSGLSAKEDETKRFIKRIVDERKTPIVIDADGLTALSPWHEYVSGPHVSKGSSMQKEDAGEPPAVRPLILTPHEGEFRKLLGVEKEEAEEVLKDRVKAVRDFATTHNVYLVLKGERNLIGAPNGDVVVNPTGNPGLGKAGNGDTLTGIITGFVAQAVQMKIDILETLVAAVYVAGLAGDIAEKKFGKRVMTASDTRECLIDVFAEFEEK